MKTVLLSMLYLLLLITGLLVLDEGLNYLFTHYLFRAFNWFNTLALWKKILVIFLGGGVLFIGIIALIELLARMVGTFIYIYFPLNGFTAISATILVLGNIAWCIYILSKSIANWGFWTTIEWLFTVGLIMSLHAMFFPRRKESY